MERLKNTARRTAWIVRLDCTTALGSRRPKTELNRRARRPVVRIPLVALFVAICLAAGPAWACPNCKETLASGPNAANLVQGYFWSIIFMMSMPFFILSGVGGYFYYEIRKARTRMASAVKPSSLVEMT